MSGGVIGIANAWLRASLPCCAHSTDGVLPPPPACPGAATYMGCQEQCILNASCVAWMRGTDDDWDCTIDETCPNLVRRSWNG